MTKDHTENAPSQKSTDQEAEEENGLGFRKGLTYQQLQDHYSQFASTYEEVLDPKCYKGPHYTAEALAAQVPKEQRSSFHVLDIGAGTGFVGQQLKYQGFVHIDALEPNEAMISEAMKKGVYEKNHESKIGGEPVPIEDDFYDAIASCGSFGENHIPCTGLLDMIRIVKPGGIIAIALRERYLVEATELIDRFEPYLDKLGAAGAWQLVKREIKLDYAFGYNGAIYTFIVKTCGTVDVEV